MRYRIPTTILAQTFAHFRQCGAGERECQALWLSAWTSPETITDVVHPSHRANAHGFILEDEWLNRFWIELAELGKGIRIQVHTHPAEAFHSPSDDAFPIIHSPGFLSLVIPNFAAGPVGFDDAFLTEIGSDGQWTEVRCGERLEIV